MSTETFIAYAPFIAFTPLVLVIIAMWVWIINEEAWSQVFWLQCIADANRLKAAKRTGNLHYLSGGTMQAHRVAARSAQWMVKETNTRVRGKQVTKTIIYEHPVLGEIAINGRG